MAEERYLNESGLLRFWNTKVKPLIYKKATLQKDLVVKNPRVTVDLPEGYTFKAGSTMEDLFNYLYRHVYDRVDPNLSVILPTVTVKINQPNPIEVGDSVSYTVQKNNFDQGKIGTCTNEPQAEPIQGRISSGSTDLSTSDITKFKLYSGSTNVPAECTEDTSISGGKITGTLVAANEGVNNLGTYYCGTTQFSASTAKSRDSYGNVVSISGVSSFGGGTTSRSACQTTKVTGYYPSFGNILWEETESTPTTINNLGNKMNVAGETIFYYGPVDTTQGNDKSFEIYFPATRSGVVKYWNTITNKWEDVNTVTTSGHFATMPAKDNTSRYPNNKLTSGKEYKLIRQSTGEAWGARKYKLILS